MQEEVGDGGDVGYVKIYEREGAQGECGFGAGEFGEAPEGDAFEVLEAKGV